MKKLSRLSHTVIATFLIVTISPAVALARSAIDSSSQPVYSWASSELFSNLSSYSGVVLDSVSCPSSSLCVATSGDTIFVSNDPSVNLLSWSSFNISINIHLNDVFCASVSLCVAVGESNTIFVSTNPAGGSSAWVPTTIQLSGVFAGSNDNVFYGVSCPSTGGSPFVGPPHMLVSRTLGYHRQVLIALAVRKVVP